MKIQDIIAENTQISEIARLSPGGYTGGKVTLDRDYEPTKSVKPLPGSSGLLYSITTRGSEYEIKLWDKAGKGEFDPGPPPKPAPYYTRAENNSRIEYWKQRNVKRKADFDRAPGKLVGKLAVEAVSFPLPGAVQVDTITVDEDYRGVGLARALYGVVLTIMKRPLLAGHSQTPGGRKNWVSLSQIPGVEMKGYFTIGDYEFDRSNGQEKIDVIMGKLGGQYIGEKHGNVTFAFDVNPNTTGKELEAHVKTKLSKVYGSNYNTEDVGLYAIWTGQS